MKTKVNTPLLFTQTNECNDKEVVSLMCDHQNKDESNTCDDCLFNCETQRLCESNSCEELIDENYNSFNWKLYKGIIYSSLSSVFFSLCSVIVKYLKDINPGELAVFRFLAIWLLTIPLVIRNGSNPFGPPELRHFLILRGILGAASLFFIFYAFRYLPIADASIIIFSFPVFVTIFACIFLNEPCDLLQILSVFLTLLGLTLTTKLPIIFGSHLKVNTTSHSILTNITVNLDSHHKLLTTEEWYHIYGVISALISTLFSSLVFIFIRKAKGAHHSVIMFNFGWVAIVETVIMSALIDGFSMPKTTVQWILIIILGFFSFCGQTLLTRSLQLEMAGPVSVVRAATDIALAFVWQIVLFNDIPDLWSISGAVLVTTCILITSVRKWVLTLPEHSSIKSKFYLLIS